MKTNTRSLLAGRRRRRQSSKQSATPETTARGIDCDQTWQKSGCCLPWLTLRLKAQRRLLKFQVNHHGSGREEATHPLFSFNQQQGRNNEPACFPPRSLVIFARHLWGRQGGARPAARSVKTTNDKITYVTVTTVSTTPQSNFTLLKIVYVTLTLASTKPTLISFALFVGMSRGGRAGNTQARTLAPALLREGSARWRPYKTGPPPPPPPLATSCN